MDTLVICFLALHLCLPVHESVDNQLSPIVRDATIFPDNGTGIHACYHGEELWKLETGDFVLFNGKFYKVKMKRVFEENAYVGNWSLFIYTCWQPNWRDKCFVTRGGWHWRLVFGLEPFHYWNRRLIQ